MDTAYESSYHEAETSHWWFCSRRDFILDIVKKSGISQDAKILDIGCASGALLDQLNNAGYKNAYGIDVSEKAIDLCQERGHRNASVMNAEDLKFGEAEFECVIASDILEHIKNDKDVLREWARVLKPNGILVVFVPAYSFLWSNHDVLNQHYRRYTKAVLKDILSGANLEVVKTSYWNFVLFLPIVLARFLQNIFNLKSRGGYLHIPSSVINRLLKTILRTENFLLRFLNLPFGVSVFAVCSKK